MAMYSTRIHTFVAVAALIALCAGSRSFADSPSVTAVLSNSEAAVGETVDLEIQISGARGAEVPEEIAADGLEIHRTGTSQRFEMNNFNVTSSITYNYTILPTKAGTFKIPPQTIGVAGKSLRTPELTLHVSNSPNAPPNTTSRRGQNVQPTAAGKLAFAELIVPKQSAFVGEMVPVQIRLGFSARSQPRLLDGPEISGQGFTAQKLQQSGDRVETIDGRTYSVATFKSAIAAARAGKFEIGPVSARAQVSVARQSRSQSRGRSPFDFDDPFSDPFFFDPFGQVAERREIEVKSNPVPFEVKALPPNPPPGFSGAIGNFTMTTQSKPTSLQVGDPITVTSTITGRGNFDRVQAPLLENEQGWHKYPPSAKFSQDDDVGISGNKTFEMVISPNEKKQTIPPFVFSYFDPAKETYVTLKSDPVSIAVEGGAPAVLATQPVPSAPATAPTPETKPVDILYQLNDLGRSRSFAPLYSQPAFWALQIIPLIGLLAFVGWKIRQTRIDNREARRIAALETEAAALMRSLRRDDSSPQEYYAGASRVVRIKTALASRDRTIDPNVVDLQTATTTFQLDPDLHERLRRLFERSDELQYSGASNGTKSISRENRREVLELIENLR